MVRLLLQWCMLKLQWHLEIYAKTLVRRLSICTSPCIQVKSSPFSPVFSGCNSLIIRFMLKEFFFKCLYNCNLKEVNKHIYLSIMVLVLFRVTKIMCELQLLFHPYLFIFLWIQCISFCSHISHCFHTVGIAYSLLFYLTYSNSWCLIFRFEKSCPIFCTKYICFPSWSLYFNQSCIMMASIPDCPFGYLTSFAMLSLWSIGSFESCFLCTSLLKLPPFFFFFVMVPPLFENTKCKSHHKDVAYSIYP